MKYSTTCGLILALVLVTVPATATANDWSLDWWTIDGGGTILASGGDWVLSGTIGQWDSTAPNEHGGLGWVLTGGFWSATVILTDVIFRDRFEE